MDKRYSGDVISNYGPPAAIVRTLDDGSVTVEIMPLWVAEYVVSQIRFDEPLVRRAKIVRVTLEVPRFVD